LGGYIVAGSIRFDRMILIIQYILSRREFLFFYETLLVLFPFDVRFLEACLPRGSRRGLVRFESLDLS
jgi:hypothetical protein